MADPGWDIPGVPREPSPDDASVSATRERTAATPEGTAATREGTAASREPTAATHERNAATRERTAGTREPTAAPCEPDAAACEPTAARVLPLVSASASSGSSAGAFPGSRSSGGSAPTPSTAGEPPVSASALTGRVDGVPGSSRVRPDSPAQALEFLSGALDYLAHANAADWSAGLQADCLRTLAVAESQQAALHARALAAFSVPGGGLASDGHRSPRIWLTWQTQATRRAAANKVASMRQLTGHPVIADALADGSISLSWSRQLAEWSEELPHDYRDTADGILLGAAVAGLSLSELSQIAEELVRRHAAADTDDGFEDRTLRLASTFDGAGRLEGDLTPRCSAALSAVLDSLSVIQGPEDTRTIGQRMHDALEEACTRLIASDCLPQRAAQPVRLELNITLDELVSGGIGSSGGPGVDCDAAIQTTVIGHIDGEVLSRLADQDFKAELQAAAAGRVREEQFAAILEQAVALLSGPRGTAAALRSRLIGIPAAAISLPLDIAGTLDTIPVHLRRAVRKRDRHCRFPGCDLPAAGCDVHHIVHRKDGGRHALTNLMLLCRFHHLIAIHRWGWRVTLHPDGTTSAVSPDGAKRLHSHRRPDNAAMRQAS